MKFLNNFFAGSAIGIANVIPGLSGGSIAVILNKYERLIGIISNFLPNIKNKNKQALKDDILFAIPLILGLVVGILLFSIVLKYLLENYRIITLFAFIGLIAGTIPMMIKTANKNGKPTKLQFIPFILTLAFALVLAFLKISNIANTTQMVIASLDFQTVLILLVFGFLAAGAMIIPGISGSLVLMLLGGYTAILNAISGLMSADFLSNFLTLIPFGIGCLVGLFFFSIIINLCLKKSYTATYYGILGFVIGSIPCLYGGFEFNTQGVIAVVMLILCAAFSYILTIKTSK
ncbi:MAG: DUF368 domain-containing protein [Clostridia bacterium]